MSKAGKANRARGWARGGYGDGRAPWLRLFLCSQMNFRQITFSETRTALLGLTSRRHRCFSVATRGGGSGRGILWRGGRVVNVAAFKKKQKKSVSSVILASELQILPSPRHLY